MFIIVTYIWELLRNKYKLFMHRIHRIHVVNEDIQDEEIYFCSPTIFTDISHNALAASSFCAGLDSSFTAQSLKHTN